jgi:hypothetical protein
MQSPARRSAARLDIHVETLLTQRQCATCAGAGWSARVVYVSTCGHTVYDPGATPECSFVALDGRILPSRDIQRFWGWWWSLVLVVGDTAGHVLAGPG